MHDSSPSKIWRMQKYRYKILGSKCKKCGMHYYPPKSVCVKCHSGAFLIEFDFEPEGKIISWSTLFVAPNGFEKCTPYIIALVKLNEGPVILSQIVNMTENEIKVNMKVKAVFRKLGQPGDADVIKYGIKFAPVDW